MLKFLEDLKKKQNKEDVINRRQAKKRVEVRDRTIETETPSKVKKVELEISEKEVKDDENVGTYDFIKINTLLLLLRLPTLFSYTFFSAAVKKWTYQAKMSRRLKAVLKQSRIALKMVNFVTL